MRTLKFAYLYAKSVTLLPTHNARTNHVMLRNRRIGLSQSGIVQAFAKFGRRRVLTEFCDAGYQEIKRWDSIYADWLCIQKSIKVTSVKPSGSVSLLAGATPGIHYPEAGTYWRTVRVAKDSVLVKILSDAGYRIEPSITRGCKPLMRPVSGSRWLMLQTISVIGLIIKLAAPLSLSRMRRKRLVRYLRFTKTKLKVLASFRILGIITPKPPIFLAPRKKSTNIIRVLGTPTIQSLSMKLLEANSATVIAAS